MTKRLVLILAILAAVSTQYGCAALAGGAVGAAVGHEVAERNNDDDDDD